MTFAFLILTIDNPNKSIDYLIKNNYNIYIHPKNKIDDKYTKYIIKDIVETSWGNILQAQINLLKAALKNKDNEYFMICSGDAYFVSNKKIIDNYNNKLSAFSYDITYRGYYKTATWWILNRKDAITICLTENKYSYLFNNPKLLNGGLDENYFLTVLKKENKNYKFINRKYTYTRWSHYIISKHPCLFNKLTQYDINDIKNQNVLFFRKILPTFSIKKYNIKKKLYVIFIGTETKNVDFFINNDVDFIIVSFIHNNLINKQLVNKCICIFNLIYKFYYDFIMDLCITYNKYLLQWVDGIMFISEQFDITSYKIDSKENILSNNHIYMIKNINHKKKIFNYIIDKYKNISFFISNEYLKKIELLEKDINFIGPL